MSDQDSLISRLRRLDSCALSDALDSLGLAGAVTGIAGLTVARPIAGHVVTVKLGNSKPAETPLRHLCTGAIEAAAAGDVIVVEQRTGIDAAGWGGVLSNAAKYKGIAGVILDGPARDIDESRMLDFPVYARFATARTARGRIWEQAFNGDITVGDVTVSPGDLVLADASAVVFIPADKAVEVLEAAERIAAKETLMTEAVWEGKAAGAVMGADYESMLGKTDK